MKAPLRRGFLFSWTEDGSGANTGPKGWTMPYSTPLAGIYVIRNRVNGGGYVGQSSNMRKRVADHFNLLRKGRHPNPHLQNAFRKYGEAAFSYEFEVICDDRDDLDALENAFLTGDAVFDGAELHYNIANTAKSPMRGRAHTAETRAKISRSKAGQRGHITEEYRKRLRAGHWARLTRDPEYLEKLKILVLRGDLSYAERGRMVGMDTSTARKTALRFQNMKGYLRGEH